ncbi:hypothetical protein ONE63_011126 [Megalurothrips usitatus]|uniref:Uncharacterized protein n=1 Tax=Megalurothrips usitatus TaxID=439358 RepID=A0AAV7XMJ4_9NEOP|nr:hypothetical protein ONE63_011126 [Megalurothrips usitatus]
MASFITAVILAAAVAVVWAPTAVRCADQDNCAILEPLWGCGVKSPQLNTCLATGTTFDIGILKHGIPKLGVPSIDPFSVPRLDLVDNGKTATLTSCKLYGGGSSVITNFTSVVGKGIGYSIVVPNFELQCSYSMMAGFLGATKQNTGKAVLTMKNYRSWFRHDAILYTKCGKEYLQWTTGTTTVLGGDKFRATFDGLGKQTVHQKRLRRVAIAAFESTQFKLVDTYLQTLFSNMPPHETYAPSNSSSKRVPYCVVGKPSC